MEAVRRAGGGRPASRCIANRGDASGSSGYDRCDEPVALLVGREKGGVARQSGAAIAVPDPIVERIGDDEFSRPCSLRHTREKTDAADPLSLKRQPHAGYGLPQPPVGPRQSAKRIIEGAAAGVPDPVSGDTGPRTGRPTRREDNSGTNAAKPVRRSIGASGRVLDASHRPNRWALETSPDPATRPGPLSRRLEQAPLPISTRECASRSPTGLPC